MYQIAGIDFILVKAVFQELVPILGPPGLPVTADLVDSIHQLDMVEMSVVAPSVLQDITASPSFLENLRCLSAVLYSGGPLPTAAGAAIVPKTTLYNLMGSSEMVNILTEEVDRQDWDYLKFSPKLGYRIKHHSGNLFELYFFRVPRLEYSQGIFSTFPDRDEYSTSDLYSKHHNQARSLEV